MRSKKKNDFEVLVGRIQATSDALQQDALVVINRSVTTRAWLTGYYIVEYEQHGADRAKYGTGLLKKLAARLNNSNFALPSLKNYRAFYKVYPEVGLEVAAYLRERFGKGYTACSLLVDAPTLALPDKSYTACSQSSPNGLDCWWNMVTRFEYPPKRCSTACLIHIFVSWFGLMTICSGHFTHSRRFGVLGVFANCNVR